MVQLAVDTRPHAVVQTPDESKHRIASSPISRKNGVSPRLSLRNLMMQQPIFRRFPQKRGLSLFFWLVVAGNGWAQAPGTVVTIDLWTNGPPDENGLSGDEETGACTGNISRPTLTIHLPPVEKANGAAVVVTPGGGYQVVCDDTEGTQIAELLVPRGIAAIVVKYRLPNRHHLVPANDARRAIRTVRYHAQQWNVDPKKIGVWGFSAGGHLSSTVSTVFDQGLPESQDPIDRKSSRPDFSILFYPVISMERGVTHGGSRGNLIGPDAPNELVERYSNENRVSRETPPTFLLHAADDQPVPVENSLRYYRRLIQHGVHARLLVFETGGHGPTAFKNNPSWLPVFEEWLRRQGIL